ILAMTRSTEFKAGIAGGSWACIADGVESAGDMITSAVLFGGMVVSMLPADSRHPYGHERAESVSAIAIATLLLVAGVSVGLGAVRTLSVLRPPPELFVIWPLGLSVIAKGWLTWRKARAAARSDSSSLRSDAFNDAADVISGLVAIAGVTVARLYPDRFPIADPLAGLAVAAIIVVGGARLMQRSLSELMDEAPPEDLVDRITAVAAGERGVARVEQCRGRRSGTGYFIDLHLEVNGRLTVSRAHALGHRVKARTLSQFPRVRDVLVHLEPAGGVRRTRS
ncbi:MAG: cation diffusion facilitator family transporter, partial [bacterium]